jgi:putative tryptophan/tyrosine transport system substrate-binding protein
MSQIQRRTFLIAAGALAVAPFFAEAQSRVYRIGWIASAAATDPALARYWQALGQRLRELDYVEGRNLLVERRYADGRFERFPALTSELVAQKVDVIIVGTDVAALAAKNVTGTIPIVFVAAGDPVGIGLVQSLRRPGGNVTGFASFTDVMIGKQMELLSEVVPRSRRVAVIYSSTGALRMQLDAVKAAGVAQGLSISLHDLEANLEGAFRAIEQEKPDVLQILPAVGTFRHRVRIAEFAAARRLPAVYGLAEYADAGGLMSYSFSYVDNWRRAADYVDRILKGAKPGDLPVQQPTKFELVINLKTAKALGLEIPQRILLRADRLIE